MVDPEGNTYERRAIEEWLHRDSTSPITRTPLALFQLAPNRALREAIEARRHEIGVLPPRPAAAGSSSGSSANQQPQQQPKPAPQPSNDSGILECKSFIHVIIRIVISDR